MCPPGTFQKSPAGGLILHTCLLIVIDGNEDKPQDSVGEPETSSLSVFANREKRFIKQCELVPQMITCPVIAGQIECSLPRLNLLT